MQYNISEKLLDLLTEKLKNVRIAWSNKEDIGYVEFELSKGELKGMSKGDLEFLSKYADDYRRDKYKLRPRSLEHFITDRKYNDDDVASFTIKLADLINEGLLKKVDVDGFKYWELAGRRLDPKEFVNLYKADDEVHRTLFKEFGLYEVYERFRDAINAGRLNRASDSDYIAEFTYNGITFRIRRNELEVNTSVGYTRSEPGYEWRVSGAYRVDKNVSLTIDVKNPKSQDVFRVLEYIEYTDMLVKEIVDNMRAIIKESTGLDVDQSEFQGYAMVDDYRLKEFSVSVLKTIEMGRASVELGLRATYDRAYFELVELPDGTRGRRVYPKWLMTVEAEGKLRSLYVYNLFKNVKTAGRLPDDVDILLNNENKEVSVRIVRDIPAITFIDVSRPFEVAKNFRELLSKIVDRTFEKLRNEDVVYRYSDSYRSEELELGKFGEILDSIRWGETKDLDEAVLKLIALKMKYGDMLKYANIPVYDFLVAQAVIRGVDQDWLTSRVNNALETVIEFIESGKLKFKHENGYIKVYFKDKPLENYISGELMSTNFKRLLSTALSLARPEEVARLRMRVPS